MKFNYLHWKSWIFLVNLHNCTKIGSSYSIPWLNINKFEWIVFCFIFLMNCSPLQENSKEKQKWETKWTSHKKQMWGKLRIRERQKKREKCGIISEEDVTYTTAKKTKIPTNKITRCSFVSPSPPSEPSSIAVAITK